MTNTRRERDFLGERKLPADAYWGVQTLRASENFPISGLRAHPVFIVAMAMVKHAAAQVNAAAGRLPPTAAQAIVAAAKDVIDGHLHDQFIVDVFQAGAGTSFHMNMNEVLANRALELLEKPRGDYNTIHPNDHVNLGQSTNDVYPTAMRLAALMLLEKLYPVVERAAAAFERKGQEFAAIVKSGRTHLQDAAPLTLGAEFHAYALTIERCLGALRTNADALHELGIGGTAVGSGLTAHRGYREDVVRCLAEMTGLPLRPAPDTFEAMQSMACFVQVSASLRTLALELIRIANDLRLLASGPNTGLAEITLPPVQPGSSIMPGKVNPVMAEMLDMVCFQVAGNDTAISLAAQAGQLELNVMMPAINYALLMSLEILTNGLRVFTEKCVEGITADPERCQRYAHGSLGLATLLKPIIGYQNASELARQALRTGRSIVDLAVEKGLLTREVLEKLLAPDRMTPDGQPPAPGQSGK